ncbi:hypothetical protein M4I32_13190 [Microbacterium sp. LRZ72]|uniref:hypothetical protein n=1 Tax=Microbacterium sp. LRZ72 TaxID=2942481 RepID=UPI0029A1A70A|nr:hypothetical protein [Microbacterium sp. LRZ72]MDX2377756.1 hypothetical protein [Microbacterium sp. LRZ72]
MAESEEARQRRLESKREWRQKNRERIREYRREYDAQNREQVNRAERERKRRAGEHKQREEERRATNAKKSRDYYHANIEERRAYQRDYLAERKAADPEGYRAQRKAINDRWRARNKDAVNAQGRDYGRDHRPQKQAAARRYYEQNAEQIKAKRRAHYAANRDREREAMRIWRAREKRRTDAGLPPERRHRTTARERDANLEQATAFFTRERDAEGIDALRAEGRVPQPLLDEWRRDCYRARAADYAHRNPEFSPDTPRRLTAEQQRMEAIARGINARLKAGPRRAAERPDPARPHVGPAPGGGGMSR